MDDRILYTEEICKYLTLPSIPKKEWDGKKSFKHGVAVTRLCLGGLAYAACSYDEERDKEPRIVKTFAEEPFFGVQSIFVVPDYMDTDVTNMDLDEDSKEAALRMVQEGDEIIQEDTSDDDMSEMERLPEWVFPEITNKEEAKAWLQQYNSSNRIKGRIPNNDETLKLRLMNIYYANKDKQKK